MERARASASGASCSSFLTRLTNFLVSGLRLSGGRFVFSAGRFDLTADVVRALVFFFGAAFLTAGFFAAEGRFALILNLEAGLVADFLLVLFLRTGFFFAGLFFFAAILNPYRNPFRRWREKGRVRDDDCVIGGAGLRSEIMTIEIGSKIPAATLHESKGFGEACPLSPEAVDVVAAIQGKKIVIFGLPGAYTPTCSAQHVPGYIQQLGELKSRGVDEVWCVSVNDGFVMAAWGKELGAFGKVRMLGDGSADFAKKLGLDKDLTAAGMGIRMQRFSLLVDNGIVKQVNVEKPGKFEVSDAQTMLKQLS
jgi:peroxiredoxin